MKRFLFILVSLIFFNATQAQSCAEQIKQLYVNYMNGRSINQNLSEEMINKIERMTNATNVNPILRAQDTNNDAISTLSVKELSDDWYMVQYQWKKGDVSSTKEIPVKAQMVDGECKITYITPIWNGNKYGDELLVGCKDMSDKIDQSSKLSFLKSFYAVYVSEYCNMPKDLNDKLSTLRQQHLTANAIKQYKAAADKELEDYRKGYDLLINGFDFDCAWCNNLEFKQLIDNTYQISYKKNGTNVYQVIVKLKKEGNKYLINDISLDKQSPRKTYGFTRRTNCVRTFLKLL